MYVPYALIELPDLLERDQLPIQLRVEYDTTGGQGGEQLVLKCPAMRLELRLANEGGHLVMQHCTLFPDGSDKDVVETDLGAMMPVPFVPQPIPSVPTQY